MQVDSLAFAGFVLAVAAGYHLAPARLGPAWLLAASYAFCATWSWTAAATLGLSTLATWAIAPRVRAGEGVRRPALAAGVAANLAGLALWKWARAWDPALEPLAASPAAALFVPVGISFYALQAIAYLLDVARGQLPPERDLVRFALYLAWFPKLLAGPIERARPFLAQLARPAVVDDEALARSAALVAVGAVRKTVLADPLLRMIPAAVFTRPAAAAGHAAWLLAYAVALYDDVAGYTSIVRGASLLFGLELSPNFACPFFARSFTEFWNRWHITLSQYMRDVLFSPLSKFLVRLVGPAHANHAIALAITVVFLLVGVWHGVGWNFAAYGAVHALGVVVNHYYTIGLKKWLGRDGFKAYNASAGIRAVAVVLTFCYCAASLIFFANSFADIKEIFASLR